MSLSPISTASRLAQVVVAPVAASSATSQSSGSSFVPPAAPDRHLWASQPSAAELQQAVESANKVLASKTSNELRFGVEKGTGLSVVKLINNQSGETVLQFPSEAMLQIARGIDQVTGAIIQRKV